MNAGLEGPGQDLGAGDQRAAGAERAARQLLGGDHHGDVVRCAARGVAAVLLRNRQAEGTHLGQAGDDLLGDVAVVAVDLFGDRHDLVLGETPEGVLHHFEVVAEVAGAVGVGQGGEEIGRPVGGDEISGIVEGVVRNPPLGLPAEQLGAQVGQCVGDERRRDAALVVALRAVVEQASTAHQGGGGVSDVVGQHLVGVDAVLGEPADRRVDHGLAHIQGGCGGGEVGGDGGCSDVGHRAMLRVGSLVFPDAISGTRDGSSPAVHMIQLDLTATSRVELCSA